MYAIKNKDALETSLFFASVACRCWTVSEIVQQADAVGSATELFFLGDNLKTVSWIDYCEYINW